MFDHLVRQPEVGGYSSADGNVYKTNIFDYPRTSDEANQVSLQNIIDRLERLERTLFGRQHD